MILVLRMIPVGAQRVKKSKCTLSMRMTTMVIRITMYVECTCTCIYSSIVITVSCYAHTQVQLIEYVTDYPTEDVEITSESSASSDSEIEDDASEESDSSSSSTSDDEPVYQTVKRRKTRNYPEPSYTDPSDSSSSGSDGDEICVSADDSESSTTVSEDESSDGASSDTSNSSSSSSSSSSEDGSDSECDGCKHRSKMYTLESSPKKHHHHNTPFQRVKASEMDDLHPLMRDLSYKKQKELGATTGYGEAAHKNMFQTRGKSFNKLKQKYKNSYRGGRIDPSAVHSHKLL
uniref:Srp40 C-terminal domain-containing protein n=1 Tax=Lygus hesperus TaxID=30085 RepID=A0A0A9YEI3_LYGHE